MESALAKLKTKQILFIFDCLVTPPKAHAKPAVPQLGVEGENKIRLIGGEELQQGLEDSRHRHGLFTYYLLRGLRGEADTNRDNNVTLSKLTGYVREKSPGQQRLSSIKGNGPCYFHRSGRITSPPHSS